MGEKLPIGFFNIRWFNKNHKHFRKVMIVYCFLGGLIYLAFGLILIDYSVFFGLGSFILSVISFISAFYYMTNKKLQKRLITKSKVYNSIIDIPKE